MHPKEPYECSNCFHRGPLNEHGRCERCDSQSVMSAHLVEILMAQSPRLGMVSA